MEPFDHGDPHRCVARDIRPTGEVHSACDSEPGAQKTKDHPDQQLSAARWSEAPEHRLAEKLAEQVVKHGRCEGPSFAGPGARPVMAPM